MVQIDLLYIAGCPNREPSGNLLREVLAELNVDACVVETEIRSAADAIALGFLGSPTIRVNGEDVEPGASGRNDFGISCRRYSGLGVPPRPMVKAALRGGVHARADSSNEPGGQEHVGVTKNANPAKKRNITRIVALMLSPAALAMLFCLAPAKTAFTAEKEATGLVDLDSVKALRKQFNEDQGSPRLLLLLSPT